MSKKQRKSISETVPGNNKVEDNSLLPSEIAPPGTPRYEQKNFVDTSTNVWNYSLLTDEDVVNFQRGTHYNLYSKFGSHSPSFLE